MIKGCGRVNHPPHPPLWGGTPTHWYLFIFFKVVVVLDYFLYIYLLFSSECVPCYFKYFFVWFSEHKVSNFSIVSFSDFERILGALWRHCFQFIAHWPLKVLRYSTRKVVVCTVAVLQVFSYLSLAGILYAHFVSV